jgi:hypothetical protein
MSLTDGPGSLNPGEELKKFRGGSSLFVAQTLEKFSREARIQEQVPPASRAKLSGFV